MNKNQSNIDEIENHAEQISNLIASKARKHQGFIGRLWRKTRSPNIYVFADQRFREIKKEIGQEKDIECDFELDVDNFNICEMAKRSDISENYQTDVARMFIHLADYRRSLWNKRILEDCSAAEKHVLAELDSLRSEIVDMKSQITSSERITAVWMVGAVFAYSKDVVSLYPILAVPLLLAIFGYTRFKEFQRNVFDLDCYLREIELLIRPDAGWVTYFFRTRVMERFFDTRQWFWRGAILISFATLVLAWTEDLSPQSLRISFGVPNDPILDALHNFFGWSKRTP